MKWLDCPYRSVVLGTGIIAVAVSTLVMGMSLVNAIV